MCYQQETLKCPQPFYQTHLEAAVTDLYDIFTSRQNADGKLTKAEFLKLVKEQLPSFPKDCGDEIFQSVDMNSDGLVEFQEFALLVCTYATANYEILQEMSKSKKKAKSQNQ